MKHVLKVSETRPAFALEIEIDPCLDLSGKALTRCRKERKMEG